MKSNKSLFNATLFKSNIVRFLPFSILFLVIELNIYPTLIYFNYDVRNSIDLDTLITMGIASDVFTFIFACVFAILVCGYLFSANKSIALHSFPIGRSALFTTNLLSAYVLLIAPQLIGFGLAIPGIAMFSTAAITKAALLLQLSTIFLFSFIALSIGFLAMMLSGNAFAGAIIYLIINFVYTALVLLASYTLSIFGTGLSEDVLIGEKGAYLLSPVANLTFNLSQYDSEKIHIPSGYYKALIIYFAVSFAICALAFLLYKLRELEVAGEMAAFEEELPFIRVIVSIIGGTVLSMFVGTLSNAGKYGIAILYIIFSFIVYFATQMVLKRKFNIFSGKLIIRWVICCAVSLGIVIGLAAYETNYIPEAGKVESANISISYNIDCKDEKSIKQIRELQRSLIEKCKDNQSGLVQKIEDYVDVPNYSYYNIVINYNMKNGRSIERRYDYSGSDSKIEALIREIENANEYVNIFDNLDNLGIKYTVKNMSIAEYNDSGAVDIPVDSKNYEKALELCKEDVKALTDNYSSLNRDSNSAPVEVWIGCALDSENDKDAVKKLKYRTDTSYVEGYYSYYDYDTNNFDIYINSLPASSKLVAFAKANQE